MAEEVRTAVHVLLNEKRGVKDEVCRGDGVASDVGEVAELDATRERVEGKDSLGVTETT